GDCPGPKNDRASGTSCHNAGNHLGFLPHFGAFCPRLVSAILAHSMLVSGGSVASSTRKSSMNEEASEEQDHPKTLAQLELRLPKEMVEKALRDFSPLKVHLVEPFENRRWIEFDPPSEVELHAGRGI